MTTWSPTDKGSNISLSGSDLIMSAVGSGSAPTQYCRVTTSKSSGKSVIRITGDLRAGADYFNQTGLSLAASTSLDGTDTTSMLLFQISSDEWDLRYNGTRIAFEYPTTSFPTMPDGTDVMEYWLDLDNDLLYVNINGNFFLNSEAADPDPVTGVGGIPIVHNTWFFHNIINVSGGPGVTLDPSPTGLPAGWSAWDAAAADVLMPQIWL